MTAWTQLQPVQVKTGITDGISTEVVSGLDEGAKVVTGVVVTGLPPRRPRRLAAASRECAEPVMRDA